MNHCFLLVIVYLFLPAYRQKTAPAHLSCCAKDNAKFALSSNPQADNSSIYQLAGQWEDQNARPLNLTQLKGKVQLMAMIFTHCGYACPRIVDDMKAIEASIPPSEKDSVGYVLVSFDSQRDDPQQLRRFAVEKQLGEHWTLLHGNPDQVRALSMLLNVKYQKLPDGNFSHSNSIIILDKQGTVRQSLDGLGSPMKITISTIHNLIQ
jgi:protein SCO1/2